MSSSESQLILEIWSLFKDGVPAQKRLGHAEQMLKAFEEFGIQPDELDEIRGEDKYIDKALKNLYAEDDEEEED